MNIIAEGTLFAIRPGNVRNGPVGTNLGSDEPMDGIEIDWGIYVDSDDQGSMWERAQTGSHDLVRVAYTAAIFKPSWTSATYGDNGKPMSSCLLAPTERATTVSTPEGMKNITKDAIDDWLFRDQFSSRWEHARSR